MKKVIGVFLLFFALVGVLQFQTDYIFGRDGYWHMKTAALIADEGILDSFPWAEKSIDNDPYADIQILFRILLLPFTLFDLVFGAKLAATIFSASMFTLFYYVVGRFNISNPLLWTALFFVSSHDLLLRLLKPRQMPLAVCCMILCVYFLATKKYYAVGIVTYLNALLHSSFILLVIPLFWYVVLNRKEHKSILLAGISFVSGIIASLILHPYFPDNILRLYRQIVLTNLAGNDLNLEWFPMEGTAFIFDSFPQIVLVGLVIYLSQRYVVSENKKSNVLYLGCVYLSFLLYSFKTARMIEFLAPTSILFFAYFLTSLKKIDYKRYIPYVVFGIVLLGSINMGRVAIKNYEYPSLNPRYETVSKWMSENTPEGSTIFAHINHFPILFFYNHNNHYLAGADSMYMELYDDLAFNLYRSLVRGEHGDPAQALRQLEVEYVFLSLHKRHEPMINMFTIYADDFESIYQDEYTMVLEVKNE